MRIPVTQADLDQGHFTKIARALRKAFPGESMGLMRAQNALAVILGYRDLHDLQVNARQSIPKLPAGFSRSDIFKSVRWKLNRHHGVALTDAAVITSKLHFEALEVDSQTTDAAFEQLQKDASDRGQLIVHDEYWDLMNPTWNPNTPKLIDAQVPAYTFAVLPDKTVFRWSILDTLMESLPSDYAEDLKDDPQYKHFGDDSARAVAFAVKEIYPNACTSLVDAAKHGKLIPRGFEIQWIFTAGSDTPEGTVGSCLGRVLFNKALGGIVPVIYSAETDDIFDAIGTLFTGGTISCEAMELTPTMQPVAFLRYCYGGYDLDKELRSYGTIGHHELQRLPCSVSIGTEGKQKLVGDTFVAGGQTYLRHQKWLCRQEVPVALVPSALLREFPDNYNDSQDVIPAAAVSLSQTVGQRSAHIFKEAERYLLNTDGIKRLTTLISQLVTPAQFDAYCDVLIEGDLPLRYEDDTEDRPDLVDDRNRETAGLIWMGAKLKEVCNGLADFKDSSMGIMLFKVQGQAPGDRFTSAYPPKEGALDEIVHTLAVIVLHAVCCKTGRPAPKVNFKEDALGLVIWRALTGIDDIHNVVFAYRQVVDLLTALERQSTAVKAIEDWQADHARMQSMRRQGKFLYVGEPVGREKPRGFADLFASARSKPFEPHMLVEQEA